MYKNLTSYIVPLTFIAGLYIVYQLVLRGGPLPALLFALLPAVAICGAGMFYRQLGFYVFFTLNYFIMGISRYITMKPGIIMLGLAIGVFLLIFLKNIFHPYDWKRCRNFLTLLWSIWFIYCVLELFNPRALWEPWSIAFPHYAFYPLCCALFIPLLFTRYKHFQWLLIIWAVLTLLAAAKGYWQRNRGFDWGELNWLFVEGGARTHIISTGIRYFSFFTDAAAYGAGMGISMVVFGISGFYVRKLWIKLLYWGTTIAAGYGLLISGTRSDIAIPFVGLIIFLLLCREKKAIFISGALLITAFVFLKYTDIGEGNRLIRRMRTSLDFTDASWNVRVENRGKITELMKDKPFGTGLGLAGVKANRFREVDKHDPLTYIATDSWFIMTYVETGIVGLTLYLCILIAILIKSTQIIFYKIKSKELKGQLYAITGGIMGILVTCYANEVLNFPNGIIVYTLMAFLYTAPYYDKELIHDDAIKP